MTPVLANPGPSFSEPPSIRAHPPRAGAARMTVFSRAGCRYCIELEEKVIPQLRHEFGDRLDVYREEAPGGLPTPTIVIGGAKGIVFPGLPPVEDLKVALRSAIEGERHDETVLSESR